jgi:hypothetical protein
MLERLGRWKARHPPSADEALRRYVSWREPGGVFIYSADLGAVEQALRGRPLAFESGDGEPPPPLDEAFLRAPVHASIAAKLPGVPWPPEVDASELRFAYGRPVCAREGALVAVTAARYGSAYTAGGQDRTAAAFLSSDAGASWRELPWTQHEVPEEQSCWPPETIDRARFEGGTLVLRWEDPWFDWEPGHAFEGRWNAAGERWHVTVVDGWP